MIPETVDYILISLKKEMKRQGLNQSDLADRLGWKSHAVSRFFSGKHQPKVSTLELVATELNMNLSLRLTHSDSLESMVPTEPASFR